MLKRELQEKADELGIDYKSSHTKAELKEMIRDKEMTRVKEEPKKEIKENKKKEVENIENNKVKLKALRNTFLPDGKFIKEGQVIKQSKAYSEIIKQQDNPAFKIIK